jgi:hypothetical protein
MSGHGVFQARTAELCRAAGIDLTEAIPLARANREAAAEARCSFRHPHEGDCQPRDEPLGYRGLDDRVPVIAR